MATQVKAPWERAPESSHVIVDKSATPTAGMPSTGKYVHLPAIPSNSPSMPSPLVSIDRPPYPAVSENQQPLIKALPDKKALLGLDDNFGMSNPVLLANNPHLAAMHMSMDTTHAGERVRQFEMRLSIAEKSNRALLEEFIRLQADFKSSARRSDDQLQAGHQARKQLEASVLASNDLISQLSTRLHKAEDKVQEERATLSTLVNHTKNVEQAVIGSQQELLNRKDTHGQKLHDIHEEMREIVRAKDQLERSNKSMMEDIRQLKTRLSSETSEFVTLTTDMRQRSKRLEDETKHMVESMRRQGDHQGQAESQAVQLRGQIESRLSELRDMLSDLRSKQDQEIVDRRGLEAQVNRRLNELDSMITDQTRRRDEAMNKIESVNRDKEQAVVQERAQQDHHIKDMLEDVNRKVVSKETKLRDETQQKYIQLEKMLREEQEERLKFERTMHEQNESRWQSRKQEDGDINSLKDTFKNDHGKIKDTLAKLDESISLVEKQLDENKKDVEKVVSAEIRSRKQTDRARQSQVDDVQNKLQVATSTLQQAIGGINLQINSHDEQLRRELKIMLETAEDGRTRAITDLDTRLNTLKKKITEIETSIDMKITAASTALSHNIRQKVEAISVWQDITSQTIREINLSVQQIPNDVFQLEERQRLMKSDQEARLTHETQSRLREIQALQTQLSALHMAQHSKPNNTASQADVENCQASIRRLAESVQTVKTVLGMKIQAEQKIRFEEVNDLNIQMIYLRCQVDPLLNLPPQPRIFIKDSRTIERTVAEKRAPAINRWSIYSAYRWLTWKSRWVYLKWHNDQKNSSAKSRKVNSPKPPPDKPSDDSPRITSPEPDKPADVKTNDDKNDDDTGQIDNQQTIPEW